MYFAPASYRTGSIISAIAPILQLVIQLGRILFVYKTTPILYNTNIVTTFVKTNENAQGN